jgi:hypothetical protein
MDSTVNMNVPELRYKNNCCYWSLNRSVKQKVELSVETAPASVETAPSISIESTGSKFYGLGAEDEKESADSKGARAGNFIY